MRFEKYNLNGIEFVMYSLIPSYIRGDLLGMLLNDVVPVLICVKSNSPVSVTTSAKIDMELGFDQEFHYYPKTVSSPENIRTCVLTILITATKEGNDSSKIGKFMKVISAVAKLPAALAGDVLAGASMTKNVIELMTRPRGLFFNIYVRTQNASISIERYLYYRFLQTRSTCVSMRVLTPLPLTPGSENKVLIQNRCDRKVVLEFYKDLITSPDEHMFSVLLRPHENRTVTFDLDDVYNLRTVFVKECSVSQNSCSLIASIPYFDLLKFLEKHARVIWYDPNGDPTSNIPVEGTYKACIRLPEILPDVQFKGKIELILVHDRRFLPDKRLVKEIELNSLEELDGKCIEFYAERGFTTRGYRLELRAFGEKVRLGEELRKQ
ncbi:hypothetical protein EYM_00580 [Ignicoccus islandicus DSM 13165]|uniref:Uncharacterized protein n=1 Tax=Ignicoccus islandicus DSM 13165 TaxID=940295 RepID=A0A0U3F911_9CREN|nr:hypothetical protein [Ignicoccus islandicus]ALU12121.1 hypothetical protein EYM_00580 [Ignicoccus islandicus DSM 13165]